jgi:hypothetical protein
MGKIQPYIHVASRSFASRKPHSSPLTFFFSAETTTLFPVFYKFITTSTPVLPDHNTIPRFLQIHHTSAPVLPTEFINEPASLYSEKEYNKTDEN